MPIETDTARRIAEMSDVAAFERLAAAVLRAENPLLYANLSHPGVQPGGKTVKAPFDNVGWVRSAEGARFVCAAHTTEQKDLDGKWLHDPAMVTPRKAGGKPTKPAGDLVKGIEEIQKLRKVHPRLAVTFALTTNRETSLDLRVSVETLAQAAGIQLDIWSVSRIAHFLDTSPTGQIIRRNHLGTPIKLVSWELLLELGERSIREHLPLAVVRENIHRDEFILGRGDTLVVGASGMGKSTACATALLGHIKKGFPAVLLKAEFVATATTIDAALEGELKRQEPELATGVGTTALSLCTEDEPLLVLVEDLNRADSPALLLNKVLSWARVSSGALSASRRWRVVCPIWPRLLDAIEDQKRVLDAVTLLRVDRYSPVEAIRAINKRAEVLGLQVDEHRATSIADRLGHDPLLIGLHDLTSEGGARGVIHTYISERFGIVASQAECTKSDVAQALNELLRHMLQHRTLAPRWDEVKSWIFDQDVTMLIRHITREGSVMRLSSLNAAETIEFRHDRVMQSLLSGALAEVLRMDALPEYVSDPFFAEAIAGAAVQVELPLAQLVHLQDSNPTTAAHALKFAAELDGNYTAIAAQTLSQWLQRKDVKEKAFSHRRYAVAHVLAETTDSHVQHLVKQFQRDDLSWYPLLAAAFRNGNINAGLSLLAMYEIGVTVAGKQGLLSLVKRMYGRNLVAAVDSVLRNADLSQLKHAGMRVGALRLAGYLGDSALAQAVRLCWDQDKSKDGELRSYLFAAARCCGDAPQATLGPVCDAWEALPEEPDATTGQPVERLAADHVAWEFRSYTPFDAVTYLVERANASEKIGWPITYMLRTVDHPDAVEHLARYAARLGYMGTHALKSDWERHSSEMGRRMSSDSRERLLRIALDEAESDDVRKQAFAFWELTIDDGDLEIVRRIPAGSPLSERALWARARRQDRSVIPEVLRKIPESPEYWLKIGRYLWSETLTEALNPLLDQVAKEKDQVNTNLEYAVAEALEHVDSQHVVAMLKPRWEVLKTKPQLVQTALLSTAPEAKSLAKEALTTSENPGHLLKYFVWKTSVRTNGKYKLFLPAQLHNLTPYLDLFPEDEIRTLWETCTRRGWLDFRAQYLEPRMQKFSNRGVSLPNDSVDTGELDRTLAGALMYPDHWFTLQVARGVARQKVVASMLDWLNSHDEERALAVVGEVVRFAATRSEFLLFEAAVKNRPGATSSVESIRFDVFSRSLV